MFSFTGFAGGVMIAASYWSLLAPAIESAAESGLYGGDGQWAFIPVSVKYADATHSDGTTTLPHENTQQ